MAFIVLTLAQVCRMVCILTVKYLLMVFLSSNRVASAVVFRSNTKPTQLPDCRSQVFKNSNRAQPTLNAVAIFALVLSNVT